MTKRAILSPISALLTGGMILSGCGQSNAEQPTSEATAPPLVASAAQQPEQSGPSAARGRAKFRECAVCHTPDKGGRNRIGPNLWNVYGQPAGVNGTFSYSRGLRQSEVVWDSATLDAYLKSPQAVIPAGRMAYRGNSDPAARADIIAYLQTLTDEDQ